MQNKYQLAIDDVVTAIKSWQIWLLLSWQDIKLRYRRSQLGPFWITISMAVTIYTMGFLYGHIFKMNLQEYFPYLTGGMLTWALISSLLNESTSTFMEAESYIKQIKLPYTTYILRMTTRNVIIFLHNIVIIIPLIFIFHLPVNWNTLFIIPGLLLIAFNGIIYGYILAMLGARFRDFGQLVASLIQVIFFMTPIIWRADQIPQQYRIIVSINPVSHFIDLIRQPILGQMPSLDSLSYVSLVTLVGFLIASYCFCKVRHRIIYWL